MGGYDRSDLEIEQERAERLRLEREVEAFRAQASGLRDEIARTLRTSTAGIRATFSALTRSAEQWAERVLAMRGRQGDLRGSHAAWAELVEAGESQLRELLHAFCETGDELADAVAHQLVAVRTALSKHQAHCSPWFSNDVQQWRQELDRASQLHDEEHFAQAGSLIENVQSSIDRRQAEAAELTQQQQTRRYLLKAVRQVCCNLGLRELEAPRWERPGDPSSRILMCATSPDQGMLRIALTLDGIQTLGEAEHCQQDLRQFSESLANGFGIRTRFQHDAGDDPRLSHRRVRGCDDDRAIQAGG